MISLRKQSNQRHSTDDSQRTLRLPATEICQFPTGIRLHLAIFWIIIHSPHDGLQDACFDTTHFEGCILVSNVFQSMAPFHLDDWKIIPLLHRPNNQQWSKIPRGARPWRGFLLHRGFESAGRKVGKRHFRQRPSRL